MAKRGKSKEAKPQKSNGANLGFENQLWAAADKMLLVIASVSIHAPVKGATSLLQQNSVGIVFQSTLP